MYESTPYSILQLTTFLKVFTLYEYNKFDSFYCLKQGEFLVVKPAQTADDSSCYP